MVNGVMVNSQAELEAARSGSIVATLSHLGVLRIGGADAESFLQGQLSCDVSGVDSRSGTYGSYCSPKGRMLATFVLWRDPGGFVMALSRDIAAAVQKRLAMYVLRSKVGIAAASAELALIGVAGPRAAAVLQSTGADSGIALQDGRLIVAVPAVDAAAVAQRLAGALTPVGAGAWRWLDIRAGVPLITAATQDQFVPQMANLELIGGVSFSKGCYTGQEIVARSQYLGRLKRRMFLANVDAAAAAGDALFGEDLGDQASGTVVNAEPSPEGGYDLLAVVQMSSRETSSVHLRSLEGPVLRFLPLPYAVA